MIIITIITIIYITIIIYIIITISYIITGSVTQSSAALGEPAGLAIAR